MKREFFKNNWQILLINVVVLLVFIVGYGRFGDVIFDSFREFYIPSQIVKGQVLYKNIFNIYAPFAYLFNATLFKVFGAKLVVLYMAGLISTLGICNLIYIIGQKMLSKNYGLAIVLSFICVSVLSPNVFNCFFPYSYGMLYGLLFVLASIYFGMKQNYPISYMMYSFAICSKYEFVLLLPILIYVAGKKDWWKNLLAFATPIVISYLPLFIEGVSVTDLIISAQLILTMSATKTLYWFYSVTGLIFRAELIPIYLINLLKLTGAVVLLYFTKNNKWFLPVIFVYCYFVSSPEIFIFSFPLILVLFVYKRHNMQKEELLFVLASLLISMKIFFALTIKSYGIYFIPFAILSLIFLVPEKIKKSMMIAILMFSISIGIKNIQELISKNIPFGSGSEIVYTTPFNGKSLNMLIEYIKTNTKTEDEILVYPEGLSVNVLSGRKSDNKFYSLIPLYIETFGEDIILKRFEITKPKYIVISNYDTSIYYYRYFGVDYAIGIFDYISKNYKKECQIGEGLIFTVYKRN